MQVQVIIFSKDRASQLDLLLRSIRKYVRFEHQIKVLYTYSNDDFKKGYHKLKCYWQNVTFVKEQDFKKDLIANLDTVFSHVMFLVDDDVFVADVNAGDTPIYGLSSIPEVLTVSLRFGKNILWDYNYNRAVDQPIFIDPPAGALLWDWTTASWGWNYPMSLDGNIFAFSDIYPYVTRGKYYSPNTFEKCMAVRPVRNKPYVISYDRSRLVGLALNRVQNRYKNKSGSTYTPESLNANFLAGDVIELDRFAGFVPNACHVDLTDIMFIKREDE